MKKLGLMVLAALMGAGAWAGEVTATKVVARQRYPWNGLVDIEVTLKGEERDLTIWDCVFAATNKETQAEIPVLHVDSVGSPTGSGTTWTRRFVWNATADVGAMKIGKVAFFVDTKEKGVQLWADGPYWSEYNVGATKPEDYGYFFWWGDTVGYKRNAAGNGWVSVKDGSTFSFSTGNCPTYGENKSELQSAGYIDASGSLTAAHDAATVHLGAPWRMPTDDEFAALIRNCDTTWTWRNGVYGRLVKGRGAYASKSIFLPAAGYGDDSDLYNTSIGYYWSSTPYSGSSDSAWSLGFHSDNFYRYDNRRYYGQSVRPLRGFAK